jgi:hypothetical protein
MSAKVVSLDDQRPHLLIHTDGKIHVVPVALALDWASGKQELPDADILRRIITEWLCCAKAGCIEHAIEDLS